MNPENVVKAVMHPNPYPYYAELAAAAPLAFDEQLQIWIACCATVVDEVLRNPHCRVRPVAEPVPKAIAGAPAGEVFGRLVRMNDGAAHERPKLTLQRALGSLEPVAVQQRADMIAARLAAAYPLQHGDGLTRWMFEVPVGTVASLIGFDDTELPHVAAWIAEFVACLSPLSNAVQLRLSSEATHALLQRFAMLEQAGPAPEPGLLKQVQHEARIAGWNDAQAMTANLLGLLSQTYEATAGLIGNCIVALLTQPGLQDEVRAAPSKIALMVQEVARFDPPVQNTRRFVAAATTIAGVDLEAGAAILLVLAAASRDALANPEPDRFMLQRPERRLYGFGSGMHACPGQALAVTIASAAIGQLLSHVSLSAASLHWSYRLSVNGRIPVFHHSRTKE